MDMQKLTAFFKWCTVLSGGLLVVSLALFLASADAWYGFYNSILPIPRETYDAVLYLLFGLYEFFFWCFCLIPYLALLIVGRGRA